MEKWNALLKLNKNLFVEVDSIFFVFDWALCDAIFQQKCQ